MFTIICHLLNIYMWLMLMCIFVAFMNVVRACFHDPDAFLCILLLLVLILGIAVIGLNCMLHYNDTLDFIVKFFDKLNGGL